MKNPTMAVIALALILAVQNSEAFTEIEQGQEVHKTCKVKVCNKLERVTFDIFSMVKDSLGETCFDAVISKSEAKVGNVLSSESRWYQGNSINPTKRSVTRVKRVYSCN